MSILSRLFGGGGAAKRAEPGFPPEEYKGYRITPAPQEDEGGWRLAARIEKEVEGATQSQHPAARRRAARPRRDRGGGAAQGETGDRRAGRGHFPLNAAQGGRRPVLRWVLRWVLHGGPYAPTLGTT